MKSGKVTNQFIRCFIITLLAFSSTSPTFAQDKKKTETEDSKTKVKPNTTVGDKAHNVIHPKNKKSHGVKAKHKTDAGKTKVETQPS